MLRKKFLTFLILEALLTVTVIFIFKLISDRSVAGLVAGFLFILIGAYIILSLSKHNLQFRSFSMYGAVAHLCFGAIPLLIVRILNWGVAHNELAILGVPAPTFHRIAEKIFVILILCTTIDFIRTFIPTAKQNSSSL